MTDCWWEVTNSYDAGRFVRAHPLIDFQFFARRSAVRHAHAWTVRVGFRAPLVPITDAPRTPDSELRASSDVSSNVYILTAPYTGPIFAMQ